MPLLVLSDADVRKLLSYADCVAVMRTALTALATGRAGQPLRSIAQLTAAPGLLGLMTSYLAGPSGASGASETEADSDEGAYGLKVITISPGNPARGLDAHQGAVLVFDGRTGMPLTLLNGSALTEIRTAAMSVLATDLLARPGRRRPGHHRHRLPGPGARPGLQPDPAPAPDQGGQQQPGQGR